MHTEGDTNTKYNPVLIQRLSEVVPKIVDAFDPEEIILYGSYARGDNGHYADIDLLIIAETTLRFTERSLRALDVVGGDDEFEHDIPINPLVYTPQEFQHMLETRESFLVSALQESVLIWKKEGTSNVQRLMETNEIQSDFKKFL